ncbi:MAG: DEAD/DEAH box helicase, partial [Nitrospirae bacterium]
MTIATFEDFNLSEEVLNALRDMGYVEPTPIQKRAIPVALSGGDLIGQAQTGTGKTAAFGIPIVEAKNPREARPYAIVLTPTRELAIQVSEEIKRIGKHRKVTTLAVYGGQPIGPQINSLKRGVHVVVGTPGRVLDHLRRKTLKLSGIKILVLDEADEMLNMGFIDDIRKIIRETPKDRQTMLFSATMPGPIQEIAKRYMKEPVKIRFKSQG